MLAVSHDALLRLWDWQETCSKALPGHTSWIWAVAFHPNGQMVASGSGDQTVQLWDVRDGICCQTLQGHTSLVCSLSFSPNGQMLAVAAVIKPCGSGMCKIAPASEPYKDIRVGFGQSRLNGHTPCSGSSDQTVRLWDVQDGTCSEPYRTYELGLGSRV